MAGTLFGKARSEVIKHPGAFSAKAKHAHMSTQAYAEKEKNAGGTLGRQANLALTFRKMRAKKADGGVMEPEPDQPPKKRKVRFACGGMAGRQG